MSTTEKKSLDAFLLIFKQIDFYSKDNGITLEIEEPGKISCYITILDKHLSSPNTAHGGSVAGFMDCTLGSAALTAAVVEGNLVSTVEFKISYFKPIMLGHKLKGTGRVINKGKRIITAEAEIWNEETNELVAKGLGTFNVYPMEKKIG